MAFVDGFVLMGWALLSLPWLVGVMTLADMERFRREAFGHYKAAIFWMMAGIALGLAYYGLIVGVLLAVANSPIVGVWPPPTAALLLYGQSVVAVMALVALRFGARSLRAIIEPRHARSEPATGEPS